MTTHTPGRWVMIATVVATIAISGGSAVAAAPIPANLQVITGAGTDITEVRYRRRYHNGGGAAAAVALGLFALGAAGALSGGYDDGGYQYYDEPYYRPRRYYRVYQEPAYRQDYRRVYRYEDGYDNDYGYRQPWRHSNRVGRN